MKHFKTECKNCGEKGITISVKEEHFKKNPQLIQESYKCNVCGKDELKIKEEKIWIK